jgi:signal transduction histidine kinase
LSLVQRIVDGHGGVVWAERGAEVGSVISVWLPHGSAQDGER